MNHQIITVANAGRMSYADFVAKLLKPMDKPEDNLMHCAIGIAGEAGELADAIKKHWVYGKDLDIANVKEELGDLCFYMVALANRLGLEFGEIIDLNVTKLEKRYPSGSYSNADAIARADKAGA